MPDDDDGPVCDCTGCEQEAVAEYKNTTIPNVVRWVCRDCSDWYGERSMWDYSGSV